MTKVTAVLNANADGTVHLPVPDELRQAKVRVTAFLERARDDVAPGARTPLAALKELRKLGTFKDVEDPVAWQRAQRRDRILPGRD